MGENGQRERLLALFAQTEVAVREFATSRSERQREATSTPEGLSAGDVLAASACWMDYMVERMGYYARGEPVPRAVDFDAVERAAIARRADLTWEGRVSDVQRALTDLVRAVRASSEADLRAHNFYGDDPGGPLLGEIEANGFICPLQLLEQYYQRAGEGEGAARIRGLLAPVVGEEEPPIACALLTPQALAAQRESAPESAQAPLVIDVRSAGDYARGHVAGAAHVPLADLPARLSSLPHGRPLVTYCDMRHPGHSRGERAAALLAEHGWRAAAIEGGFPAWREARLDVETGPERV